MLKDITIYSKILSSSCTALPRLELEYKNIYGLWQKLECVHWAHKSFNSRLNVLLWKILNKLDDIIREPFNIRLFLFFFFHKRFYKRKKTSQLKQKIQKPLRHKSESKTKSSKETLQTIREGHLAACSHLLSLADWIFLQTNTLHYWQCSATLTTAQCGAGVRTDCVMSVNICVCSQWDRKGVISLAWLEALRYVCALFSNPTV